MQSKLRDIEQIWVLGKLVEDFDLKWRSYAQWFRDTPTHIQDSWAHPHSPSTPLDQLQTTTISNPIISSWKPHLWVNHGPLVHLGWWTSNLASLQTDGHVFPGCEKDDVSPISLDGSNFNRSSSFVTVNVPIHGNMAMGCGNHLGLAFH